MDLHIVTPQPEDAAALSNIARTAKQRWGYPDEWMRRWKDDLTITPEYIRTHPTYAATSAGNVVGFCALRLEPADAWLDHLWVLPEAMGRGYGRALFRHAELAARAAGAIRIKVESDPHAEGFYQRMGATTFGRKPASVDGVERFLPLLEKRLE
jgi:GNAT superfamily N-acetyltransferase